METPTEKDQLKRAQHFIRSEMDRIRAVLKSKEVITSKEPQKVIMPKLYNFVALADMGIRAPTLLLALLDMDDYIQGLYIKALREREAGKTGKTIDQLVYEQSKSGEPVTILSGIKSKIDDIHEIVTKPAKASTRGYLAVSVALNAFFSLAFYSTYLNNIYFHAWADAWIATYWLATMGVLFGVGLLIVGWVKFVMMRVKA